MLYPARQSWFDDDDAFDLKGSEYWEEWRPSSGTDSEPLFEGDIICGLWSYDLNT